MQSQEVHPETVVERGQARQQRKRRTPLQLVALMGPAFVVGAWQFGPGNLASAVQAGSGYQYSLIWVVVISTLLMIAFTDMSVRIGIKSPVSLLSAVKQHLGKPTGVLAGLGVFAITLMFSVGNAVGSGLGLSLLFGGSPVLWTLACTAAVGFILLMRNVYSIVEKLLVVVVATMSIGFVASAFISRPDWVQAAEGLVPTLPPGSEILVVAVVGTNFSINAAFYTAYGTQERRRTEADYRDVTLVDTIPGIIAPGVMTALVIAVSAAVLGATGTTAATIVELARVFEPLAGSAGSFLFALGLSGAAFSSMIANATAGGTMLADGLGFGQSASSKPARMIMASILLFGVATTLLFQGSPVGLIVVAQSLTVLVAPFLGLLLLIMSNRRSLMGDMRNKLLHNIVGAVGFVAILTMSVRLVMMLLN